MMSWEEKSKLLGKTHQQWVEQVWVTFPLPHLYALQTQIKCIE
jgi:hypothetical protein